MKEEEKELSFEHALKKLEQTVMKMEQGDLNLDENIKFFEEGNKLVKLCTEQLNKAEKKVEIKKTEQQVINTSTEQTKNPPEKVKEFIYKYDNVYFVQMSSWPSRTAAEQEAARYQRAGRTGIVEKAQISGRGTWYRVLAGKFNTLKEAEEFKIKQK